MKCAYAGSEQNEKERVMDMYLALYRKWRPKVFEDVISQPHITVTLKNQVVNNRVAHAYLFTGSRGTGKTTCSKILAKAVNCLHPVDGNPCLECEVCKGIEDGSIMDVIEIDAASNNGVENIRELREEAVYSPAVCKYKVYIIDETHMLSTGAFNALLKIMEEPPAHVIFILATTEVHKVPATILSRCQRFDFHRIKSEDIAKRLLYIAEQEKISLEPPAAELIARIADGGMRDALSLLDQCAAFGAQVDLDTVSNAAGIAGRAYLFEICDAVLSHNPTAALEVISKLHEMSIDLQQLCSELISQFRSLMILKTVSKPGDMIVVLPDEMEKLKELSKAFSMSSILHCLAVLQNCLERLSKTSGKRIELEMCMIRLCNPKLDSSSDALIRRLDDLELQLRSGAFSAEPPKPAKTVAAENKTEKEKPQESTAQAEPVQNKRPVALDMSMLKPVTCWVEILQQLSETDKPLHGMLVGSKAYCYEDMLFIDTPNTILGQMLKKDGCAVRLLDAVQLHTGNRYRLRLKTTKETSEQNKENPLDALAKRAQENGVSVNLH